MTAPYHCRECNSNNLEQDLTCRDCGYTGNACDIFGHNFKKVWRGDEGHHNGYYAKVCLRCEHEKDPKENWEWIECPKGCIGQRANPKLMAVAIPHCPECDEEMIIKEKVN